MKTDLLVSGLRTVLEETFEIHHGMYTDKGTSLFETLSRIDAKTASIRHGSDEETIAGHIYHLIFYHQVIVNYITGQDRTPADWSKSWTVKEVSQERWEELQSELKHEYQEFLKFIEDVSDWNETDIFEAALGTIAHNAFHLGAIRELATS